MTVLKVTWRVPFPYLNLNVANGIAGSAVWRALRAGPGTYTPPVRGFLDALFASP